MKKYLVIILAVCAAKAATAQQYVINADVTGFANGTKFYLKDNSVDANIDSGVMQNGHFVMKGKLPATPQSLWLSTTVGQKFYYANLLIGNDAINIKGDAKDFPFDLSITGSPVQSEYNGLIALTRGYYKKRNALVAQYFALEGDSAEVKGKAIWKVINKMDKEDYNVRKNYILSHLNSYTALNELFYLKNKFPKDSLQTMYNSLTPEFKKSRFAQRIATYLKVGDILKKGDMFADFEAMDKSGKKHTLSSKKGKYILLDFSTTYCGPCIQSLDDLNKVSKKYAGRLELITFSGDGGKATWLKGLNRDKPTWLSVWDGKGDYGETIMKYGVTGFPTFVLIDPQGKIVDKWSGFGKEDDGRGSLETKVEKLLANK